VSIGVPAVSAAPAQPVPGENGTWVFLFGDMLVFGTCFVTFMLERAKVPEIFDVSRKTLHVGVGLTNTLVPLTSSLCVVIALAALRSGVRRIARRPSWRRWLVAESSPRYSGSLPSGSGWSVSTSWNCAARQYRCGLGSKDIAWRCGPCCPVSICSSDRLNPRSSPV